MAVLTGEYRTSKYTVMAAAVTEHHPDMASTVWDAVKARQNEIREKSTKLREILKNPNARSRSGKFLFSGLLHVDAADQGFQSAVQRHTVAVQTSTSFANPAVTIARSLTDTFSGIRPENVPDFIMAQIIGSFVDTLTICWLWKCGLCADPNSKSKTTPEEAAL